MLSPIGDEEALASQISGISALPAGPAGSVRGGHTVLLPGCDHPHPIMAHKEEHTLLCCVSLSHVALIWKLNWN